MGIPWNSLPELEQLHNKLSILGLWGPIIIGIVGLVIGSAWSILNYKIEQQLKHLQSEQGTQLAEQNKAEKVAIQKQLAEIPKATGVLEPGSGIIPPVPDIPKEHQDVIFLADMLVFFANHVACIREFPYTIIQQDGEKMLALNKKDDKILLSAKFFNVQGKIVCEIVDNQFHLNLNNVFRFEQESPHRLVVINDEARPILDIEYINPQAVRIYGDFFVREGFHLIMKEDILRLDSDSVGAGGVDLPWPIVFQKNDLGYAISLSIEEVGGAKTPVISLNGGIISNAPGKF